MKCLFMSLTLADIVGLFHKTNLLKAPAVVGLFQSSLVLCLFKYLCLRSGSLCLVKSECWEDPKDTVFLPSITASNFLLVLLFVFHSSEKEMPVERNCQNGSNQSESNHDESNHNKRSQYDSKQYEANQSVSKQN